MEFAGSPGKIHPENSPSRKKARLQPKIRAWIGFSSVLLHGWGLKKGKAFLGRSEYKTNFDIYKKN